MKSTIYLTDPEVSLHKTCERIVLKRDDQELKEIRCDLIDNIILLGPVQFTTQVATELARNSIELSFCNSSGKLLAQLSPANSLTCDRLLKQCDLFREPNWQLRSAQNVLLAKISGCIRLINTFFKNYSNDELAGTRKRLIDITNSVYNAKNTESVMGLEGAAGQAWFATFKQFLFYSDFNGRNRRPPKDPVNAMLSFCYSLTSTRIFNYLSSSGLYPQLGFLHKPVPGRPALALDLLEEFRIPLVDRFVIQLFNKKIVQNEHFEERDGGVFLTKEHFKRVLTIWEEHLRKEALNPWNTYNWIEAFKAAIAQLRACIDKQIPYLPLSIVPKDNAE